MFFPIDRYAKRWIVGKNVWRRNTTINYSKNIVYAIWVDGKRRKSPCDGVWIRKLSVEKVNLGEERSSRKENETEHFRTIHLRRKTMWRKRTSTQLGSAVWLCWTWQKTRCSSQIKYEHFSSHWHMRYEIFFSARIMPSVYKKTSFRS